MTETGNDNMSAEIRDIGLIIKYLLGLIKDALPLVQLAHKYCLEHGLFTQASEIKMWIENISNMPENITVLARRLREEKNANSGIKQSTSSIDFE